MESLRTNIFDPSSVVFENRQRGRENTVVSHIEGKSGVVYVMQIKKTIILEYVAHVDILPSHLMFLVWFALHTHANRIWVLPSGLSHKKKHSVSNNKLVKFRFSLLYFHKQKSVYFMLSVYWLDTAPYVTDDGVFTVPLNR